MTHVSPGCSTVAGSATMTARCHKTRTAADSGSAHSERAPATCLPTGPGNTVRNISNYIVVCNFIIPYFTGMGIENLFQLRTGSNWINPSTLFVFMLNNSLIDRVLMCALQNSDWTVSKDRKLSKVWLNFTENDTNSTMCPSTTLWFHARVETGAICWNISRQCSWYLMSCHMLIWFDAVSFFHLV